jgi:plasmid maintenance system antidote protein VapI
MLLAKALDFPGIYEVVRGRAISADTAIRLGKYFGLPAQFWLNLQNDYDLRVAEGSGVGKKIKPRAVLPADTTNAAEFSAVR